MTSSSEPPLLFLTTSSASIPTGRNARAQARSASAKRTNPAVARYGSFGSFSTNGSQTDQVPAPKRRKIKHIDSPDPTSKEAPSSPPHLPLRILATHFNQNSSPLPPNVNFEDVLSVASFHIRRRAAHIVRLHPERTLDALRCRQWCSVSSTFASLGRSPYLDSAIACVVSKVRQVVTGAVTHPRMLACYAEALHLLREAVQHPADHDRGDMLAAVQLLALYEMLDFPDTQASWTQHVAGAAAMAKALGAGAQRGDITQAAPMFVEAVLSDDAAFFESRHWNHLLHVMTMKTYTNSEMKGEILSCFIALRSLFATSHAAAREDAGWAVRFDLLSQTHELRERFMLLIVQNKEWFLETRKLATTSRGCDVLGLCLVSVMVLDKLILLLRKTDRFSGTDIENETRSLCLVMVGLELNTAEVHPGKELQRAFKRQGNYPTLTYDD